MKVLINQNAPFIYLDHNEIMRLAELLNVKIYPFHRKLFKSIYEPLDKGYSNRYSTYYYFSENPDFLKDDMFNYHYNFLRHDPIIHQLYYEFKEEEESCFYTCTIVDVPDDVRWHIVSNEEEGHEWVAENHRTWSGSDRDGEYNGD